MTEPTASLNTQTEGPATPELRPPVTRALHALGETLVGFLLGGAVFVSTISVFCVGTTNCNDFGGIAFYLAGFVLGLVATAPFFRLCRRFRFRLRERKRLDIAVTVITATIWAAWLIKYSSLT